MSLDGREDGDTINKNRLQRKWCRVEREDDNSVLHTLRCGDVFFSPWNMNQFFIRKMYEDGEWPLQAKWWHHSIFMD